MNGNHRGRGGFLKIILLIVIALIVLGFFGYNLRDILNSEGVRGNLAYGWEMALKAWNWIWDTLSGVLPNSS